MTLSQGAAPKFRPPPGLGAAAAKALLAVAVIALFAACVYVIASPELLGLAAASVTAHVVSIGLAVASYLLSHAIRALRLAVLAGSHQTSLRRLVEVHFYTAAVSLIAPLKLGEIYRVIELRNVIGSFPKAVLTVWLERTFDVFALIALMMFAAINQPGIMPIIAPLLMISLGFIAVTYVGLVVLPENLPGLSLFVLRRYRSRGAVPVLQAIESYRGLVRIFLQIAKGKTSTTAVLTALIWSLEVLTLWLVLPAAAPMLRQAVTGLLIILSETSSGASYLLATLSARGGDFLQATLGLDPGAISEYAMVTRLPLLFLGAMVAISYVAWRLWTPRSRGEARP